MASGTIKRYADSEMALRFPTSTISDLNNLPSNSPSLYLTDKNTLNTPYKAGQTGQTSAGFIFSCLTSSTFGVQMYFMSGRADKIFVRALNNGTWGGWQTIATEA